MWNSCVFQLQWVACIFPTLRDDRCNAVKTWCTAQSAVPSQRINSVTLSKPNRFRSVVQKIALQINCQLGGELWAVNIPLPTLMVGGVDVYHDPTRRGQDELCHRLFFNLFTIFFQLLTFSQIRIKKSTLSFHLFKSKFVFQMHFLNMRYQLKEKLGERNCLVVLIQLICKLNTQICILFMNW